MDIQNITKAALEKAYQSQVVKLFNVYVDTVITAKDKTQEIHDAGNRFKKGLDITKEAFRNTSELAGVGWDQ